MLTFFNYIPYLTQQYATTANNSSRDPKSISKCPAPKNYHGRDRPDRERPLPRRVIIPQDVSDRLASPTIIPSVKINSAASRNTEVLA
ncbi:hypothetical protein BOTNAR_0038g00310 [Botryotinia narcissicola]|uniref:Uncharacterized protein n=1 Tax=Botryotinia narcissicola TaxID=278944 RepID=A0A4Z1J7U4_9HELO|nr:hypothetical protein BOTNAR_0038g00310 [Botryotinia narcissicola]